MAQPASSRARASSGALIEAWSQPSRILAVTGTSTASTIARTTRAVACDVAGQGARPTPGR